MVLRARAKSQQKYFSSKKHGAHQSAANSAPSRSTKKYTKVSAAHFCNALFLDYLFSQRFILEFWVYLRSFFAVYLRSFLHYLFLQRFILRQFFRL